MSESTRAAIGSATSRSAVLGAMFLMATSAIGPGFITQTTTFTAQLGAAFAFAVLASILVDIAVQLNVWRVIGVSGQRAHELGNKVLPGVGYALAALVVAGGLVFNIGNVGGTVGGYITYAGAHRLLDSGLTGPEHVGAISRSSVVGILVTGVMRILLFLAVLGVVAGGVALAQDNPAASAFEAAAGQVGLRVFGIILWAASITSVIGAAYTSVSFLTSSRTSPRRRNLFTVAFIALSAVVYLVIGTAPVTLLVFAGAFNGLILPIGFTLVLWVAWRRRDLLGGYRYPMWLLGIGVVAWLLTLYLGYQSLGGLAKL